MEEEYRNYIDKKIITKRPHNACGLNATGDSVSATVNNVTAWGYLKTALALVGAFVVAKYVYGKMK
jgi:hypothetical protein